MRSFRELGAIRGQKGNLEAWLFRIAGNVVTDHYRKRAVFPGPSPSVFPSGMLSGSQATGCSSAGSCSKP
ncbi:MAG: hypothetical protein WBB46_12610 [Candidatus Deferrimicrobiaceae bacterium]